MNCQDCRAQVCKAFEFVDGNVPQVIKEMPLYCKAGYEASYKAICLKCDIFVQMECEGKYIFRIHESCAGHFRDDKVRHLWRPD